jgi:glutamine amidotransferase
MSGRIALIDYGAGNLTSVRKGLTTVGAEIASVSMPDDLAAADGIVVPGVGHFSATAALDDRWIPALRRAIGRGVPLLGICLGLQWLFEGSDEAPTIDGLGLLPGRCFRLPPTVKVPHVGWNSLEIAGRSRVLDGLTGGAQVYFTHSYAAPVSGATVAVTTHGIRFAAAVEQGNVLAVQFHPEKSGSAGLQVLKNFMGCVQKHAVEAHHRVS